jgi:dTDP-4-dehydrorhamnose reductase
MLSDYLVIRTTCIYGWEPQEKNFVINLIKKNRTGISVEVPLDQITTPTYAGNLAEITWKLVQGGKRGIYNVVGATLISRLDFAFLIARIFGLNKELITSVKTEYLKRKAKRPLNGGLKIEKTEKELSIKVPSTEESLLEMKKEDKYG